MGDGCSKTGGFANEIRGVRDIILPDITAKHADVVDKHADVVDKHADVVEKQQMTYADMRRAEAWEMTAESVANETATMAIRYTWVEATDTFVPSDMGIWSARHWNDMLALQVNPLWQGIPYVSSIGALSNLDNNVVTTAYVTGDRAIGDKTEGMYTFLNGVWSKNERDVTQVNTVTDGLASSMMKCIWGTNNSFEVACPLVQGGYVIVKMERNNTVSTSSYGGVSEWARVIGANYTSSFVVENREFDSVRDSNGTQITPSINDTTKFVDLLEGQSIEWKNATPQNGKIGILFYGNSYGENAEIYIDGMLFNTVNTSTLYEDTEDKRNVVYINVYDKETVDVVVKHAGVGGHVYVRAIVSELRDMTNYVSTSDFIKLIGTEVPYINSEGSNDIAISIPDTADFIGSVHGGQEEVKPEILLGDNGIIDLNTGNTFITSKFETHSITKFSGVFNPDGRIRTRHIFVDGGYYIDVDMKDVDILTRTLYTNLSCTHPDFTEIVAPIYIPPSDPQPMDDDRFNRLIYDIRTDRVTQLNPSTGRTMESRWGIFEDASCRLVTDGEENGAFVSETTLYKKIYYTYTRGEGNKTIRSIAFQSAKIFT